MSLSVHQSAFVLSAVFIEASSEASPTSHYFILTLITVGSSSQSHGVLGKERGGPCNEQPLALLINFHLIVFDTKITGYLREKQIKC